MKCILSPFGSTSLNLPRNVTKSVIVIKHITDIDIYMWISVNTDRWCSSMFLVHLLEIFFFLSVLLHAAAAPHPAEAAAGGQVVPGPDQHAQRDPTQRRAASELHPVELTPGRGRRRGRCFHLCAWKGESVKSASSASSSLKQHIFHVF